MSVKVNGCLDEVREISHGDARPDGSRCHRGQCYLWGSITRPLVLTWGFYAVRSESLMRPPRTGLTTVSGYERVLARHRG
jgi:hypothetical protein